MTTKPSILTRSIAALLALGALHETHAVNGTWTNVAGGSWPTTGNWTGGVVATGIDGIADFSTLNITATATVTLDGARTVGTLRFGDLTTSSNDWVLNTGTGGTLTMDVTTGQAVINVANAVNNNTRTATIGAVLAGNDGINVTSASPGTSVLALGAANTFTGGLTISGGIVQLNNATAAGSNTITVATTALNTVANRLQINGGVAIANNVIVNATAAPGSTGVGAIQHTGTGLATVNGTITLNGTTSNGGHFGGGNSATNALVLNGTVTSSVQVYQRTGFVRYSGGGSFTDFLVHGTAIIGANNGLASGVNVVLSNIANATATLDIGTFNQTIGALTFSSTALQTVSGTTGVLTLGGNITSAGNQTHVWTGNVNLGGATRNFTAGDGTSAIDINVGAAFSNGTLNKLGTGTLALNGASSAAVTVNAGTLAGTGTVNGGLTINATGTLSPATSTTVGTFTTNALTFGAGASTVNAKIGVGGDLIAGGAVTAGGTTTINLGQFGGLLPLGDTNIITYTGTSPGLGGFVLGTQPGHAVGTLVDTGTAIAYNVTSNDRVIWDGTNTTAWGTGVTGNWKLQTGGAQTDFITGDDVIFQDTPVNNSVVLAANVTPSNVAFTNTVATSYSVTGTAGIIGTTGLTKTGDGTVTLANPNTYVGTTAVSNGTLVLNYNNGTATTVLSTASTVNVTGTGVVRAIANDSAFAFNNNLTGNGTVEINSHATAGTAAQNVTFAGNNTGFTGTLRLLAPVGGNFRLLGTGNTAGTTQANLGGATIEVQSGGQIYTVANATYTNNISSLAGIGYLEAAPLGNLGALRLESASNWAGSIVVAAGGARINAHNTTATVSGNISGGPLEVNTSTGFANVNGGTLIFTGTNSYSTTLVGDSTSGTVASRRLNIGAGGTSGTLGTGAVSLNTNGHNAVLGFDRSDGYTLGAGNTITATGSTPTRSFIDFDTLGSGFSDGGATITLGGALSTTGGQLRVAHSRTGAIANFTGATTAGQLLLGAQAGFGNGTVNLNSGAVMNVGTVRVSTAALNTSTINVNNGGTLTAFNVGLGEVNSGSGVLNQAVGSTVSIDRQLRVGHFATNTSTYNMNGGTLTMTGVSPNLTPSTAGGGAASATGDNNINALVTPELVGGGIYIGIDGQGTFNHTGGTVTTNWIVLDNRGASGAGTNMLDGLDRYNLSGTGELRLRSNWGFIARNDASALVTLGGGSIVVDNTGTGTGTGANITIPLDATLNTVAATTTTLNTNGVGNGFTLAGNVRGTGTLNVTGGGTINLSTAGVQIIESAITGTPSVNKIGTGATTLSNYAGNVNVNAGLLIVPASHAAGDITVADGAALSGEPILVGTLSLGSATGSTIFFNPTSAGALTTGTLAVAGVNNIDLTASPAAATTYTVINYTSKTGAGTFQAANPTSYRVAPVIDDTTGNMVTITYTGQKSLTWTGAASTAWNINNAVNWADTTPAPDVFFNLDTVSFPEGGANPGITLTGGLAPSAINVTSDTTNYSFTSTAGNQITGGTGITKTGASTLTLTGPNTHSGVTSIGGGTVSIAAATSLGSGLPGNSIALSNGGRLTLSAALDLGVNRSIAVGTGGGNLTMANAAAQTITIPGSISGSGALAFDSTLAGGGTFALSGNNSGYNGAITVNSISTGLSTLRFDNQQAVPTSGSITLNFPAAGATGNATTLAVPNLNLPAGLTLNLTSGTNGANSLRTQVTLTGTGIINSPVTLAGNNIVQFTTTGTHTYNGSFTETTPGSFVENAPGSFSSVLFLRGTGTHIVNGVINLPSAGATVAVTDGPTVLMNSTGNTYASMNAVFGTVRLGDTNALPTSARLLIGQAGDQVATVDLNGFDQTVGLLAYAALTNNVVGANFKGIANSHPTNTSTFTFDSATRLAAGASIAVADQYPGVISGRVNVVKNTGSTVIFAGTNSTFTGNVIVNGGVLRATGGGAANGANGVLGAANVAGRTITIESGATLEFTTNNIFGNGIGNANLPSTVLNGGALTSSRYNVLGPIALNGATLTQSSTDAGGYEGFQFKGAVTVGGSAASIISTGNSKANHLDANTVFTVADATGSTAADLLVSAPLRNQSNDFPISVGVFNNPGGLTKEGAGTMELSSLVNSYTGTTTINAGTLLVSGSISGSAVVVNGGTLGGGGTTGAVTIAAGATLAPGTSPGTITTASLSLDPLSSSAFELTLGNTTVGGGINDLAVVNGNFTLDGTLFITELGGTLNDDTYTLFDYSGTLTDNGLAIDSGFTALHPNAFITIDTVNTTVLLTVPEPSAIGLLLAGALGLLGRRRKK